MAVQKDGEGLLPQWAATWRGTERTRPYLVACYVEGVSATSFTLKGDACRSIGS
jgi:hypothetical protein